MTQFITGLRLELLVLMHSQIFWGWEGSLFLQVDSLYPVVTVHIYFSLLDKRFELQWEKLLVSEFAESDKEILANHKPCYDSS